MSRSRVDPVHRQDSTHAAARLQGLRAMAVLAAAALRTLALFSAAVLAAAGWRR